MNVIPGIITLRYGLAKQLLSIQPVLQLTCSCTFHQAEQRSLDILKPKRIEYSTKHKDALNHIFGELADVGSRHLETLLQTPIKFKVSSVYESSYNQFLTIVASDYVHHLIELKPSVNIGLISFHTEIMAQMLNFMIGGKEDTGQSFVEFSRIEEQLIDKVMDVLADAWNPLCQTHFSFDIAPKIRYQADHHRNLSNSLNPLLIGNFDCRIGLSYSKAALCIPRAACDKLLIF